MITPNPKPVQGKTVRVGVVQNGLPATFFWKFWVSGNEVYASNRFGPDAARLSFHESGYSHIRLGFKTAQQIWPPSYLIGPTGWLHAAEIRFLLSEDALQPPPQPIEGNKKATVIQAARGHIVILNLMIGPTGALKEGTSLPFEGGARILWCTTRRDGRTVFLFARGLPWDEENRKQLHYIRHELNPHANFSASPLNSPYVEIRQISWSEGGNIIFVVPMGREGYRVPPPPTGETTATPLRTGPVGLTIPAPNGDAIAAIALESQENALLLRKNASSTTVVQGSIQVLWNALTIGGSFQTAQISSPWEVGISTKSNERFELTFSIALKQEVLHLTLLATSTSIRFDAPDGDLAGTECLISVHPTTLSTPRGETSNPVRIELEIQWRNQANS